MPWRSGGTSGGGVSSPLLGGGVSRAGEYLIDAVRREYPKYMLYKDMPMPSGELAVLGADAGIIGASMLGD